MDNSAASRVYVSKPDSFAAFQYRRAATGFCWAIFGIGGLGLTLTYFPWPNVTEKNKERRVDRARKAISASFRLFLKVTRGLGVMDYKVEGIEELRNVKGAIIVANHPTILDYVFLASQLPTVDCLVKAKLKENFFLKGVVKAADYLLNDASEELLGECRSRLAAGHNILIFPEGTRTVPGEPMKLHRGVAHIALRCGCPIEAAHVHCSDRWLDKSSEWYEIPNSKPVITIKRLGSVDPSEFTKPDEEGYSLSARRLTRALAALLESPKKINF